MPHLFSSLLVLSFLSTSLAGCSSPAEPTLSKAAPRAIAPAATVHARSIDLDRDADVRETDPSQAASFFVWAREGEERTVTYRLDASGHAIEELDGIVIATGAGTWQWQVEDQAVPTIPCEYYDDEGHAFAGDPVEPGTATRASLRHRESGAEQLVVDASVDLMGNADVKHDVGIIASIGPYIFIEESTYVFACGAHGITGVSTTIWDVATGTSVALPMDLGALQAPRKAAMSDLADDDNDAFATTDENLELTELVPRFTAGGGLVVGLQFTAPTCYACTRGGWSSYTKSTVVDGPAVPAMLSAFASAPPAVRAFQTARPDVAIKGWSAR